MCDGGGDFVDGGFFENAAAPLPMVVRSAGGYHERYAGIGTNAERKGKNNGSGDYYGKQNRYSGAPLF